MAANDSVPAFDAYVRIEIEDALKCLDSADAKHIAYHLHGALAALGQTSDPAQARRILNMGLVVAMNVAAMQAAWIEWKHGDGAEAAMIWIENTLDGPELIPHDATDAQAHFDAARDREYDRMRECERLIAERESAESGEAK